MSRRKALKNLALASAASLTLPAHTFAKRPKEKLGIALVGLGRYAQLALRPALRQSQNVQLKGLVSGTPSKLKDWSSEFDIPKSHQYNYETFDQITDNPDIDIIYIVLPNFMHAEYTIRALEAGKHVICEKPMALNSQEAEAMIVAAKKAGKLLSVGYRLHYEAHHQKVMELQAEKPYGPINFIEAGLAYHMPDASHWRLQADKSGGGAIMDLGVYAIQAARYASGEEPAALTAQAWTRDHSRFKDLYETFFFQLQFPSGIVANCTTSYSSYVDRLHVSCYKGFYTLQPSFNGGGSSGTIRNEPMNLPKVNQQAAHMDDFANSIQTGQPLRISGEDGLTDLRIIESIMQAIESGKRVDL